MTTITPKSERGPQKDQAKIAIEVKNVSKTFKIPHEAINTMRGAFVNILVKKKYETFKALDNINFSVKKGEFFGIIGRNGSGKSTLLKILAGIYQPDIGQVKINGLISPFLELGIGFNPSLSGRDNIYLNGSVLGLTKKQIDKKFKSIVQFSELERFIDQKVKNYSSGMQVRLAFSVAIHANRDILLMDEVLAVGDINFQQKCLREFSKYRNMGKTIILVTHDIDTVKLHCNRALLLKNGKIFSYGNPEKVVRSYMVNNLKANEQLLKNDEQAKRIKEKTGKAKKQKQSNDEFGTKVIKITNITILDKNDKKRNSFLSGELMKIKIDYLGNKKTKRPHFGIEIKDINGKHIVSTNHLRKKQLIDQIDKNQKGYVECIINKIPFLTGIYTIGVMLYSDKMNQSPYAIHHISDAKKIIITNNYNISDDGDILIDCDWRLN